MAHRWQRPSLDTKFHIDMGWWDDSGLDIRVYIRDLLCDDCREQYADSFRDLAEVDWIDDVTGQVSRVDGLWHCLRECCSLKPEYITEATPVVDSVFRTFLANGNKPLTMCELQAGLGERHSPAMLLRILTRGKVFMGIRPIL